MTSRCPLCGGVVVGAHFHGIDPEQRCDACDTLAGLRGAAVCACSLADLRRALAEQAAGEAERVREAVERERERMSRALADAIDLADEGWGYADNYFRTKWDFAGRIAALRARATSPAPEAAPPPGPGGTVADGWRDRLAYAAAHCAHPWPVVRRDDLRAALREVAPAPEPVAAERAERCSACGRPTTAGEDFGGPCVYASDAACAERAVIEAAEAFLAEEGPCSCGYQHGTRTAPCSRACRLQSALHAALAAARKGGNQ